MSTAQERFGPIRGVVVCAGILHAERIVGREGLCDLNAFRRVVEVNLVGTFNVLRLAAGFMQHNLPDAEGERGVIVTTASTAAFEGQIGQAAYAASKGGIAAMTLPAARELGRFGIRVVSIAPGVFETPMMRPRRRSNAGIARRRSPFRPALAVPRNLPPLWSTFSPTACSTARSFALTAGCGWRRGEGTPVYPA